MFKLTTIEDWLAQSEGEVPNLREGCEKRIVWAGHPAEKTAMSVVFIHGFSVSSGELWPLPDLVAKGLSANLFYTRLRGHGQDGAAMADTTLAQWQEDVTEALEIAHTLGDDVLVIACSTGCTLATLALAGRAQVKGLVQISPNYRLAHRVAQFLLDLPLSETWAPLIAGKTRSFPVKNKAHGQFWTTSYPSKAAHPMACAVRAARRADLGRVMVPTLACVNQADQVVHAASTGKTLMRWGGDVTRLPLIQTTDDDPMGHIMAGDVFSPNQTGPLAKRITDWAKRL